MAARLDSFGDIFPPRNLGADADPWGGHAESRIIGLERVVAQSGQRATNDGRTANAKADVLSDQITELFRLYEELQRQQEILDDQQQMLNQQQLALAAQNETIIELINSLPRTEGEQVRETGWSIDSAPVGGPWKTIVTATVPRPSSDMNRVAVTASGSASATTSLTYGEIQTRLLINGYASQPAEGMNVQLAQNIRSTAQASFFREVTGLAGSVTVQLQARGRYSEFTSTNIADLTVSAAFSRYGI